MASKPTKRIHVGIDYGTSQSKIVFRDYSRVGGGALGAYAVVVRPIADEGGAGDFRIPSTVLWQDDELFFGLRAEDMAGDGVTATYRSLKVRMALPDFYYGIHTPPPAGLSVDDLASLFVLYLLQVADRAIQRYNAAANAELKTTMTLGVPMSQLDRPDLSTKFMTVARVASEAFLQQAPDLRKGIKIDAAITLLGHARKAVDEDPSVNASDWIRAEASSALIWAFNSPVVPAGLYSVVDVGAGTTASSWFRITAERVGNEMVKKRMAFFGAACNPPAADAVEYTVGKALNMDPTALRGAVNPVFATHPPESIEGLGRICDSIARTYREAFGRAYLKDKQQSHWYGAKLFLIGGGTLINPVNEALRKRAWPQLEADPPLANPGQPTDLFEEDGTSFSGDSRYLLVAYGLSHVNADVPEVTNPSEIEPFTPLPPPVRDLNHEDLYGDA